jgi:hypothetical protein
VNRGFQAAHLAREIRLGNFRLTEKKHL